MSSEHEAVLPWAAKDASTAVISMELGVETGSAPYSVSASTLFRLIRQEGPEARAPRHGVVFEAWLDTASSGDCPPGHYALSMTIHSEQSRTMSTSPLESNKLVHGVVVTYHKNGTMSVPSRSCASLYKAPPMRSGEEALMCLYAHPEVQQIIGGKGILIPHTDGVGSDHVATLPARDVPGRTAADHAVTYIQRFTDTWVASNAPTERTSTERAMLLTGATPLGHIKVLSAADVTDALQFSLAPLRVAGMDKRLKSRGCGGSIRFNVCVTVATWPVPIEEDDVYHLPVIDPDLE